MILIYTVYEMNSDEARDTVRRLRAYDGEGNYLVSGATASLMTPWRPCDTPSPGPLP